MLSDVQYNELIKCYADPVAVMERHECGRDVLRLMFVDYFNIKDIVSCSLVNRKWKQLLGSDPEILFRLCTRPFQLNKGFDIKQAFFSEDIRNNSEMMLKFVIIKHNHPTPWGDYDFVDSILNPLKDRRSYFETVDFFGDQLDKHLFVEAVKLLGCFVLTKISKEFFHDPDFVLALADQIIIKYETNIRDEQVKIVVPGFSHVNILFDDVIKVIPLENLQYWLSVFRKCKQLDVFECLAHYFRFRSDDFLKEINEMRNNLMYPHLKNNCECCY